MSHDQPSIIVEYRTIDRFPGYRFGSDGTIIGQYGRFLKPILHQGTTDYQTVALTDASGDQQKYYIHRVIAEAFLGPCPQGMEVAHNNGDAFDNRAENLRICTHLENEEDKVRHGTLLVGSQRWGAILTEEDIPRIHAMRSAGALQSEIAREFGVSTTAIGLVLSGQNWGHVAIDNPAPKRAADNRGERNPAAKLNEESVRRIRALAREGASHTSLAKQYGVTSCAIGFIIRRRTWKSVED